MLSFEILTGESSIVIAFLNNGWSIRTCKVIAPRLGMTALPRVKRGFAEFKTLLAKGPIWAAGAKGGATGSYHVVIIAGVADTGLWFFDPLPLNVGRRVWRTWDWLDNCLGHGDRAYTIPVAHLAINSPEYVEQRCSTFWE